MRFNIRIKGKTNVENDASLVQKVSEVHPGLCTVNACTVIHLCCRLERGRDEENEQMRCPCRLRFLCSCRIKQRVNQTSQESSLTVILTDCLAQTYVCQSVFMCTCVCVRESQGKDTSGLSPNSAWIAGCVISSDACRSCLECKVYLKTNMCTHTNIHTRAHTHTYTHTPRVSKGIHYYNCILIPYIHIAHEARCQVPPVPRWA